MPIKISKGLKDKLPAEQRSNIEKYLWTKSGGKCFLCEGKLNDAADIIYADHNIPEKEDGKTDRDNLNLVHKSCNDFKRNNPSARVRPYLKFQTFVKALPAPPKYGDCLGYFDIKPKNVSIQIKGKQASFHLPKGGIETVEVFSETNNEGRFYYAYLEVPKEAIFNDDECQPRTIKLQQLWAIYMDIERNPLHEPPSCRLDLLPK